ncbi:MAG TPA: 1-deoxy-D-xylulose-5-phosphate synthase [Sedimentisphaerales bacterium]|nr:1-deoxy-D-xylulose-5-phosphate synthase [Sedimentisphaerales bacterium]
MSNFLENINTPADIKKLSVDELNQLAEEIRHFILKSVSKTGGHLASNLGAVELTIALHYVFDFASDSLLWDVGHQCYTHKIITSRKDKFSKLREADGLSGFPNPEESEYDVFSVGHAGTSIATAIGMAVGRRHQKSDKKIVAVVGDASVVNGLSFEALNNLGLVKRQMLIVLNDNSMAIDKTQGAVASYFSKVRLSETYEDLRKTTSNILEHLPVIGKGMEEAIERIKKSIRMVLPASQMFEGLKIPYFGPVDGHDIGSLIKLFTELKKLDRPAILHVHTIKGKGFIPAGKDPRRFHSTGPFGLNGESLEAGQGQNKSFTKVFGDQLVNIAGKDDKVIAITCAMCDGTGLRQFSERFPERFYDVGIAEGAAIDIAAGLAKCGLKPVVCIYSTFLQRCFDQIFQEVSLQNLPVVFCIDRAGLVGNDGPTHHGLMDIGFLRMMPNLVLISPVNETEMALAMEFAINCGKPVVIRYPKDFVSSDTEDMSACNSPFELGKSVTVKSSQGSKTVVVAYGSILNEALKAAKLLETEGVYIDVINARFAAPVDDYLMTLLDQGKNIITVEDHGLACGFGSAVLEKASNSIIKAIPGKIMALGAMKKFIKHDTRAHQLMQIGVNADSIVEKVKMLQSQD